MVLISNHFLRLYSANSRNKEPGVQLLLTPNEKCQTTDEKEGVPPPLLLIGLYCTLLYSTVLYSTIFYCTVMYSTLLYSTVLYCTLLYSTVLLLYSTVLDCLADLE